MSFSLPLMNEFRQVTIAHSSSVVSDVNGGLRLIDFTSLDTAMSSRKTDEVVTISHDDNTRGSFAVIEGHIFTKRIVIFTNQTLRTATRAAGFTLFIATFLTAQ